MFDSLKKSLGISKAKKESKVYKLGTGTTAEPPAQKNTNSTQPSSSSARSKAADSAPKEPPYFIFTICFYEMKMGMSIQRTADPLPFDINSERVRITNVNARPEVTTVHPGTEAAKNGKTSYIECILIIF
jgi:hypothetical protein